MGEHYGKNYYRISVFHNKIKIKKEKIYLLQLSICKNRDGILYEFVFLFINGSIFNHYFCRIFQKEENINYYLKHIWSVLWKSSKKPINFVLLFPFFFIVIYFCSKCFQRSSQSLHPLLLKIAIHKREWFNDQISEKNPTSPKLSLSEKMISGGISRNNWN